jgi:hypothetical protein
MTINPVHITHNKHAARHLAKILSDSSQSIDARADSINAEWDEDVIGHAITEIKRTRGGLVPNYSEAFIFLPMLHARQAELWFCPAV